MIDLRDLATVVIASTITGSVITIALRKPFERMIDSAFRRREVLFEVEQKRLADAKKDRFAKELAIFPEMLEVAYRARNAVRDCATETTRTPQALAEFNACRIHLTENLYKYKLFVSETDFRRFHLLKVQLQDFGVLLDEVTRSTSVDDAPSDPLVRALATRQLVDRAVSIARQHDEVEGAMRAWMRERTGGQSTRSSVGVVGRSDQIE